MGKENVAEAIAAQKAKHNEAKIGEMKRHFAPAACTGEVEEYINVMDPKLSVQEAIAAQQKKHAAAKAGEMERHIHPEVRPFIPRVDKPRIPVDENPQLAALLLKRERAMDRADYMKRQGAPESCTKAPKAKSVEMEKAERLAQQNANRYYVMKNHNAPEMCLNYGVAERIEDEKKALLAKQGDAKLGEMGRHGATEACMELLKKELGK